MGGLVFSNSLCLGVSATNLPFQEKRMTVMFQSAVRVWISVRHDGEVRVSCFLTRNRALKLDFQVCTSTSPIKNSFVLGKLQICVLQFIHLENSYKIMTFLSQDK